MGRGALWRWAWEPLLTLRSCGLRRGRLYAAWIAVHGVLAVLPAITRGRLDWPPLNAWEMPVQVRPGGGVPITYWVIPLEANYEGTPLNTYSIVLWSLVAALALAQVVRPAGGRRWLWLAGWISVGGLAALIAMEEHYEWKGAFGYQVEWLEFIAHTVRWEVVVAPFAALPVALAGNVIYRSVTRIPALAMLSVAACIFAIASLAHEIVQYNLWMDLLEEGSEMLLGAVLAVILYELLMRYYIEVKHEDSRIGVLAALRRRWRGQA